MTWDEFLLQFEQHIEGKVDASIRTANRPDENAADEVAQKVDASQDDAKSKFTSIESAGAKSRGTNRDLMSSKGGTATQGADKYDIPNNCKLDFLKAARIQKLEENYILMAHPYPQLEGELLLFQANVEDQSGENTTYRDYSLVKRRTITSSGKLAASAMAKKKLLEDDAEKTKIQCLEVNIADPLSTIDWQNMADIIREIQALAWIQLLPVDQKSSCPYQFNCMHILPNANIPFSTIPLEKMISNKMTFNKKYGKQMRDASKTNSKIHLPVQSNDKEAEE